MKIKMIGLGKMGYNLMLNMKDNDIDVEGFDINEATRKKAALEGFKVYSNLSEVFDKTIQNIVWVMLPAGKITNSVLDEIKSYARKGDVVIDGGNSNFEDSERHALDFKNLNVDFFDIGTSGGVSGARTGASLMIGGNKDVYNYLEKKLFSKIAIVNGYMYAGEAGSGHYLKMIHNAILYGMMQTLGEGFELLEKSDFKYNLEYVAATWSKSAVIRGWLMELTADAFSKDSNLSEIKGIVSASEEARWTIDAAFNLGVPTPAISSALIMRLRSKQEDTFSGKVVASLRNEVGGHTVTKK